MRRLIFCIALNAIILTFRTPADAQTAANSDAASGPENCKDAAFRERDFAIGSREVSSGWLGPTVADVTLARKLNGCTLTFEWDRAGKSSKRVDGFFAYSTLNAAWLFAYVTEFATSEYFVGHSANQEKIYYGPISRVQGRW